MTPDFEKPGAQPVMEVETFALIAILTTGAGFGARQANRRIEIEDQCETGPRRADDAVLDGIQQIHRTAAGIALISPG